MLTRSLALALTLAILLPTMLCAQRRDYIRTVASKGYLKDLHAEMKRAYYDPTYRGLNMDSLYEVAERELDAAKSEQELYRAIERYLEPLHDSHTYFIAPSRVSLSDFQFGLRFFGDTPLVVSVDFPSRADEAGLRRGQEIVEFDGKPLTRDTYRSVIADFLSSHPIRPLHLLVRDTAGAYQEVSLMADTAAIYRLSGGEFKKLLAAFRDSSEIASSHMQATIADSIFYWRLPAFGHGDKAINKVMERARKHAVLVLDLRGNRGGSFQTLTNLTSYFVDREVVVGDLRMRVRQEKFVAKPHKNRFGGRLLLLVDSETGSAAEIFARLMQLEQRAVVYGDRTSGSVLAANIFQYGEDVGASITVSDFVLPNGERLEGVGVKPDRPVVAPAKVVAADLDAVLTYTLLQAGARVHPAAAAKLSRPVPRQSD